MMAKSAALEIKENLDGEATLYKGWHIVKGSRDHHLSQWETQLVHAVNKEEQFLFPCWGLQTDNSN